MSRVHRDPGDGAIGVEPEHEQTFDDNTSRELDDNLKRLGQDRFEGLVLDLRGNPGGILNEAVDVSGAFLRRGTTVVSARGREYPPRF